MKYLPKTQTLVATGLLLLSAQAFATPYKPALPVQKAPANNYVGASVGQLNSDSICDTFAQCDTDEYSWKVYSGVRVSKSLMIEGGYLSTGEVELTTSEGLAIKSNLSGYTVAGVATYPYSDQIEFFGKAGAFWWESEFSSTAGSQKVSDTNTFVGLGANYDLGDNMGIKAEWERFSGLKDPLTTEKHDIDLMSVGVTFSSL